MTDNEFMLKLIAMLDKAKSKKRVDADIKALEKSVSKLRLTATLLKGESKKNANLAIRQLEGQLNTIKLKAKIDQKNLKADVDKALQNISFKDIDLGVDTGKTKLKMQKVIAEAKKVAQNSPISLNIDLKKEKLNNQLTSYLSKNSKIRESEGLLKEADQLREKIAGISDKDSLRNATDSFQLFKSEVSATGYATKSTTDKIKNLVGGVTKVTSAFGVATLAVSNFQKSLKTIRENDSIMTEISKTSNMTKAQLTELGNESFDIASKFGRLSGDYLLGVQEMARSGYENASKEMAELSLMAQSAGDMTADVANAYIIATDNAYKYQGNIQKLNEVLDGQNAISNANSVALQDMAESMSKAGTVASSYRVSIEDLSAMIGTIEAVTKSGGSEVGNGIKAILINLQNITSNKIVDTLDKANASMTEFVNGTEKLRNPISIIRDLAKTFNQLDEDDPLRAEILTNIGGKYQASKLGALLQNIKMFDKMLVDYSNGAGSALEESNKSANDLTGTLNKLSNSWTELVNTITNKSALKTGVGFFDGILQSATKLIQTFDVIPVALASVTAFLTAKNKDVGLHIFDDKGNFDLSGNFMGIIDVDQIKHYRAAKEAIAGWNNEIKAGKIDINKFESEIVKNNTQLRNYLSTCTDGSASLKGYKQSLQAAGEATTSLRLGTILLNTALSLTLGVAIQGVITGIDKLSNHIDDTRQKAQSLSNAMSDSISSISSNAKEVKELNERYQELSKGVDIAGNNVSLTASDYEEYKNIVSRLSEIMPNLTTMFNAQGEKIGFVAGKLKDANAEFKEYIRNSANKFLTDGNGEETVDDMIDDWNNTNTKLSFNYIDELKAAFSGYSKSSIEEIYSAQELIEEYQKLYNMSQDELYDYFDWANRKQLGIGYALGRFLKIDMNELKGNEQYLNTLRKDLNSYITEYQTVVDSSSKQIQEIAQYMFLNNDALYNEKLSGDQASYISNIISSLSNEFIKSSFVDKDGELVKAKIQTFVDNLIDSFTGGHGVEITGLFSKLFTLDTSKLSVDGIRKQVEDYINRLYALMQQDGESLEEFKLRIGISAETYIGQDTETLANNVKEKLQDEFDNKVGELTLDELQIAAEKIEVPDGVLLSWDELAAKIKEAKEAMSSGEGTKTVSFKQAWKSLDSTDDESLKTLKQDLLELAKQGKLTVAEFKKTTGANTWLKEIGISAEEAIEKINKLVSSADQLASMKSGISSISDILGKKKENLSKKNTAGDGIGIDTLSSMPEDLKSCKKEYEKFCEVLGKGSSTMAECRDAADKLATAYVNNGNFLAKLTAKNKDYYISVLQEMGVQNAEAIVTNELAKQKGLAAMETANLTDMTADEIKELIEEKGKTDDARNAMRLFAIEKIYANSNGLDTSGDVQQLSNLLEAFGIVIPAVQKYRDFMANYDPNSNSEHIKEYHKNNAINGINDAKKALEEKTTTVTPPIVNPAPTSSSSSSSGDSGKSAKAKESTQVVDWIGRKLDVLQDKIDLTKAKFENLFAINKQKNNITKQIKQTTKLLNNQQKAIAKYQQKANSIKLPKSLKNKVKNGAITGKVSSLIKEYGEDTAKKITDYQDYIDKIKDLKKAVQEAETAIRELKEERNQLYIDRADSRLSMLDAKADVALNSKGEKAAEATNKILQQKVKWTKQYYNYQIKNAKLEKDSIKVAELQAQKQKALLDIKIGKYQNLSDEAEANISRLDAQTEIARDSEGNKSAEATNNLLQEKIEYTKEYYKHQIKIAKLEGDSVKAAELQVQKEKEILSIKIQKQQNLADEAEAKYNLNQQYESNAVSAKNKNKYEAESLSYLKTQYNKLIKIAELEGDVTEQKRLQAEKQEKINESYKKMYDNIKAEYDSIQGLNDANITTVQANISTLEAAGKSISKSMYETMMKINAGTKEKLLQERAELIEASKDFKYGSDEWYQAQNDLQSISQGLATCTQNTIDWQKAINNLDFKKFTLMAAQLDATKEHLDFLVEMLSHKDLTSKESGGLTDEGFATISLRFAGIENYKKTIENAQNDLEELYRQHADGSDLLTEEEFLAKREEQLDIIRESTEAIADEKDAIIDLVENALELQIDSINELIEKKKKALATEKDLYEYQRKIAKQTKNIALIQKQIAALSGDNSEEARARIQKLKVSLEEAQEDLKDTEYDKWHSDQEDMLDNLADEVEDFWERIMDDLKKNIDNSLDSISKMIADNPEAVARALDELGLGDALSIITTYNPDGTHTDYAIDYGGNSYESTYDKDGNNVENDFSLKDIDPEIKDPERDKLLAEIRDSVDEADKILHSFNDTEQKDVKDGILGLVKDKKGDTIPSTGTWTQENILDNDAKKDSNNPSIAKVEKLLDSALHKPTTDAEKKRMESDPLLKYLSKNYNGKTISKANEAKLGALFGISVDKDNITEAKAKRIRDSLKSAGFAKGGIASTLNKVALENGDDGWVTLQRGEAVLTEKQTEMLQGLTDKLVLVKPLTDEQASILAEYMNTPYDFSKQMQKYGNIPVNNTNNTSVNVRDINVHLDGSGIKDMDTMFQELSKPTNRQRMTQCVLGDPKNPFQSILSKF